MVYIHRKLRQQVITAARSRCEYCRAPQDLTFATFHIDHIIPKSALGKTIFNNLCFSCQFCNLFKKGRARARDPETGRQVRLFNPRRDRWEEHFRWGEEGTEVIGLTAQGRATIGALQMNNAIALTARRLWVVSGVHPPEA